MPSQTNEEGERKVLIRFVMERREYYNHTNRIPRIIRENFENLYFKNIDTLEDIS